MSLCRMSDLSLGFISSIYAFIKSYSLVFMVALLTCSLAFCSEGNVSLSQENSSESNPLLVLIAPPYFQASAGDILNISYLVVNNGNRTLMNVSLNTKENGSVLLNHSILLPRQASSGIESILLNDSDFSGPIIRNVEVSAKKPNGKIITQENSTSIKLMSRE